MVHKHFEYRNHCLLSESNIGKPMGPDDIHHSLRKDLTSFVVNPSSMCFNRFVIKGRLLKDWRKAVESRVFKTGASEYVVLHISYKS